MGGESIQHNQNVICLPAIAPVYPQEGQRICMSQYFLLFLVHFYAEFPFATTQRETERQRDRETERQKEREREIV